MKKNSKPYMLKVTYYGDESGMTVNKDFEKKIFTALEKIGYRPTGGSGFDFSKNCRDIGFILSDGLNCPVCGSPHHKYCGVNPSKPA